MHRRIIYIMHVDWDWAKQRPHFLAEHLSAHHDVLVLYPYARTRKNLTKNGHSGVRVFPFFPIAPFGRYLLLRNIVNGVWRALIKLIIKWYRPDIVWISSPEMYAYLPQPLPCKLVYDCMDDILAFPTNFKRKNLLSTLEIRLIHASDCVFCSSDTLRNRLINRSFSVDKFYTINNAVEPSAFANFKINVVRAKTDGRRILGYIGTISTWFDIDAILRTVNEFDSIEVHLLGPIENSGIVIPDHDRIKCLGAVRHDLILKYIYQFDALIMPFKVTNLIKAVDPVKIYEYIFFNKPIISIWYDELEKFSDFIDFYITQENLVNCVNDYYKKGFKKKYTDIQRRNFIVSNTWEVRSKGILEYLSFAPLTAAS